MNFWETFWPLVFIVSVIAFAALTIVVTIGGVSDIRAMLRSIEDNHSATQEGSDEPDPR